MGNDTNPRKNFNITKEELGYVDRKEAQQSDYDRIGFMSGLEVHQQLLTKKKLFCRCPAGIFQKKDEFDAEVVRHMRPTLSELGEYDGTALMEFKTKKNITYRISHPTACTYEVDDTPPFPIDREALDIALEIALASKMSIVGEVHITRKQYLDGSIPAGFQRTAIVGIGGEIQLKNKKINLIQMSIEEDSCREVSDIGHNRIYRTDRLGMPLIETVTHPEMVNPDEVKEACDFIRFLNRSTGKVRTGIGAGRQDVNVSCKGGTRVEIKGVAHTKWIPELTHIEAFRQWALLEIKKKLTAQIQKENWKMSHVELNPKDFNFYYAPITDALGNNCKLYAVNLPHFKNLLSHFTQPGKPFADEFASRLKVIACIEKPNMATSEDLEDVVSRTVFEKIRTLLHAGEEDAQILFWSPTNDVATALDTIEERALMTFDGVPQETRKSFEDGTTVFERVLPGADRMYPDTDSAPIPIASAHIETLRKNVPDELTLRYEQMQQWEIPSDCYNYIFTHNYFPFIKKSVETLQLSPKAVGVLFGQHLKHEHGKYGKIPFSIERICDLLAFSQKEQLPFGTNKLFLSKMFQNPTLSFEKLSLQLQKKKSELLELEEKLAELKKDFIAKKGTTSEKDKSDNILGTIRTQYGALVDFTTLSQKI